MFCKVGKHGCQNLQAFLSLFKMMDLSVSHSDFVAKSAISVVEFVFSGLDES